MKFSALFDLSGKTALVTGCNKGIGRSMAIGLAAAGADILGVSNSLQPGSDIEKEVTALGRSFKAYQADFSDRDSLYSFIGKITAENNRIDILVNNAGMILRNPAAEHSDEYWDKVMAVNLDAQFILSREIGKKMIGQGSGKIIFTASLLSFQGGINVPGYAASKGAIASLIKALANEWAPNGINVNGIAPGYVATDNTEALRNDPERSKAILSRIPAGRWAEPDDFVGVTVFLASSASDYVNGTIITVDGGWMGR
ncbi:MAG TPA: SDR family oxidoreductase [Ferruginibacter sp.]|nr:SDR family oxidoreductase [Ferruginibacter sp.]